MARGSVSLLYRPPGSDSTFCWGLHCFGLPPANDPLAASICRIPAEVQPKSIELHLLAPYPVSMPIGMPFSVPGLFPVGKGCGAVRDLDLDLAAVVGGGLGESSLVADTISLREIHQTHELFPLVGSEKGCATC